MKDLMIGKMPSMMSQRDWPIKPRGRMCPWPPVRTRSILQRRRRLRKKSNKMSIKERKKVLKKQQL